MTVQPNAMKRPYNQKRRAERAAETRQRIVEATVALHGSVGPARTTLSMIAERAGVQRHTLYAHFPDERSLFLACSGHSMERDPPPDPAAWADLEGAARLRAGLDALYSWYARNAELLAAVLRDAEHHETTRWIAGLRFGPPLAAYREALAAGFPPPRLALLGLAMSFHSWRTLVRDEGLDQPAAVEAMVAALTAKEPHPR